ILVLLLLIDDGEDAAVVAVAEEEEEQVTETESVTAGNVVVDSVVIFFILLLLLVFTFPLLGIEVDIMMGSADVEVVGFGFALLDLYDDDDSDAHVPAADDEVDG